MITLYVEDKPRLITDILYGTKPFETSLYKVELLDVSKPDELGELAEESANAFLLNDQTNIAHANAAMLAHTKSANILLYNKPHKTMEQTLSFYEQLSITTGAVFAIGHEAADFLRQFQRDTDHISCALEEIDFVAYPGVDRPKYESCRIYAYGKVAHIFARHCEDEWAQEGKEFVPPFEFVQDINEANTFVTFEELTREYMRMIDNRMRNVYVPFNQTYTILDPRSFFRGSNDQILQMIENNTSHQTAAMLRPLFEDMRLYIEDVFVPQPPAVNTMKVSGNIDLFQAIAYNLSRTVN